MVPDPASTPSRRARRPRFGRAGAGLLAFLSLPAALAGQGVPTPESVLGHAVGHLEDYALPVGALDFRCVIGAELRDRLEVHHHPAPIAPQIGGFRVRFENGSMSAATFLGANASTGLTLLRANTVPKAMCRSAALSKPHNRAAANSLSKCSLCRWSTT